MSNVEEELPKYQIPIALERKAMIFVCSRILRMCAASGRIYARRVEMVTRMLSIEKKLNCPRTTH